MSSNWRCSMTLFRLWAWFICVALTLHRNCYLSKKICLISTLLIYILEYIYITFIYNIVLLLYILFMYNTLYTYKSKNVLLIVGKLFSGFLRPVEQLQVFWMSGCSVVSDKRRSPLFTPERWLRNLTVNKSPNLNHVQPGKMQEEQYTLPPVLR